MIDFTNWNKGRSGTNLSGGFGGQPYGQQYSGGWGQGWNYSGQQPYVANTAPSWQGRILPKGSMGGAGGGAGGLGGSWASPSAAGRRVQEQEWQKSQIVNQMNYLNKSLPPWLQQKDHYQAGLMETLPQLQQRFQTMLQLPQMGIDYSRNMQQLARMQQPQQFGQFNRQQIPYGFGSQYLPIPMNYY